MDRDLPDIDRDDKGARQDEESAELENLAFDLKKEFSEMLPDD